jgi:hypothetical protein
MDKVADLLFFEIWLNQRWEQLKLLAKSLKIFVITWYAIFALANLGLRFPETTSFILSLPRKVSNLCVTEVDRSFIIGTGGVNILLIAAGILLSWRWGHALFVLEAGVMVSLVPVERYWRHFVYLDMLPIYVIASQRIQGHIDLVERGIEKVRVILEEEDKSFRS